MTGVFTDRGHSDTEVHTGACHMRLEAEMVGVGQKMPRDTKIASSMQKPGERHEQIHPLHLQREGGPGTPRSLVYSLYNCEKINLRCLSRSLCGILLQPPYKQMLSAVVTSHEMPDPWIINSLKMNNIVFVNFFLIPSPLYNTGLTMGVQ